jgi:hypothetical protein
VKGKYMALIKCKECGTEISSNAESCPKCGAKIPHTSFLTKLVLFFIIIGIAPVIISFLSDNKSQSAIAEKPDPAKQLLQDRMQSVVATEREIKTSLRDPDSAVWEKVLVNNDGSVVCIQVRAKNGFGGMARSSYVRYANKITDQTADIRKHCKQPMHDVTDNIFD